MGINEVFLDLTSRQRDNKPFAPHCQILYPFSFSGYSCLPLSSSRITASCVHARAALHRVASSPDDSSVITALNSSSISKTVGAIATQFANPVHLSLSIRTFISLLFNPKEYFHGNTDFIGLVYSAGQARISKLLNLYYRYFLMNSTSSFLL